MRTRRIGLSYFVGSDSDAFAGVADVSDSGGVASPPSPAVAPTLTSVSPNSASAGASDTPVNMTGANYTPSTTATANGSPLSSTYGSPTALSAVVPAGLLTTAGNVLNIAVTNTAGTSATLPFTVNHLIPAVSSRTPTNINSGSGNTTVNVVGSNFDSSSVVMSGSTAFSTTVSSSTALSFVVPSSLLTSGGVVNTFYVSNSAPGGGNSGNFSVTVNYLAPTTTGVPSPSSIVAGSGSTTVTIPGTNFVAASVVYANGTTALTTTVNSSTSISAVIPSGLLTNGGDTISLAVQTPAPGGGTSGNQTFTVNRIVPVLNTVSPTVIIVGSGNTTVTANSIGSTFDSASQILINGTALTTTFVNAGQLTASIPSTFLTVTGSIAVTVQTPSPGGGTTSPQTIAINNPVPTAASLSSSSGERWFASRTLTVNSSNVVAGAKASFGATSNITPTSISSGVSLTFTIPDAELDNIGSKSVTITNPTPGGGTSNALTYMVTQPAALVHEWIADTTRGLSASAGSVSSWADAVTGTSTYTAVQGTGTNQPTVATDTNYNSKSVVVFSGTQWLTSPTWAASLAQPATWVWVGENTAATAMCFDGTTTLQRHILYNNASARNYQSSSAALSHAGSFLRGIYMFVVNGASSAGYAGSASTVDASGNPGTDIMTGINIGQNAVGSSRMIGRARTLLAFNKSLSLTERQQVGAYCSRDSGLAFTA